MRLLSSCSEYDNRPFFVKRCHDNTRGSPLKKMQGVWFVELKVPRLILRKMVRCRGLHVD